jgi:hypothetical protein
MAILGPLGCLAEGFIVKRRVGWGMDDYTGTKLVDGHDVDDVADVLARDNTVAELRAMASDLGVSRERGMNKRETAGAIAYQADFMLSVIERADGSLEVRPDR